MRLSYLLALITIFFTFIFVDAQSENEVFLSQNAFERIEPLLLSKFPSYYVIDTIAGEINMDGESDCIALLERNVEEAEYEKNELAIDRITVFLTQKNGEYYIVSSNKSIIGCTKCGGGGVGDPYQGISIENGIITFNLLYGACDRTAYEHIFNYNPKKNNWYLFQSTRTDWNCRDITEEGEVITESTTETAKNFGKVTFADFE